MKKYVVALLCLFFGGVILVPPIVVFAITHSEGTRSAEPYSMLVLGSGLNRNGGPGALLRQRLEKAVVVAKDAPPNVIVVSGDATSRFGNEPQVMRDFLVQSGIDPKIIVVDEAGNDTSESCLNIQKITQSAGPLVIVTQEWHARRASWLCSSAACRQCMFRLRRERTAR